jgi:hypothetical protein
MMYLFEGGIQLENLLHMKIPGGDGDTRAKYSRIR